MIDKRLFKLPGIKPLFKMLAGLTVLQAFMILFQAIFLAKVLVLSWQRKGLSQLGWLAGAFFFAFLGRHGLTWIKNRLLDQIGRAHV